MAVVIMEQVHVIVIASVYLEYKANQNVINCAGNTLFMIRTDSHELLLYTLFRTVSAKPIPCSVTHPCIRYRPYISDNSLFRGRGTPPPRKCSYGNLLGGHTQEKITDSHFWIF